MSGTSPENVESRIAEHVRNALRGEVLDSMAEDTARLFAGEVVKILGPARAAEIGDEILATEVLRELQMQMNLPMSEWPLEPGGIYIARKLARKFAPKKWWQFWR